MRELDMSQHGGAMEVYAGYGFGKKWRKSMRALRHHAKGISKDVGKVALSSALSGHAPTSDELMNAAAQSAKKRAKNEAKAAIRPYL